MMLPRGSHLICATLLVLGLAACTQTGATVEVDDVDPQNSTQLKIAEEKFRFVSQWETDNGNAYRLYAPKQGSGDSRFRVCEIEPLKGSSFAPTASCRSIR